MDPAHEVAAGPVTEVHASGSLASASVRPGGLWLRFRSMGVGPAARAVLFRLRGSPPTPAFHRAVARLVGATALEIGGPSAVFAAGGPFPAYLRIGTLDNVDYAARTLWSVSGAGPGDRVPLRQTFVAEAVDLAQLPSESYDVVLASHVLEHLANPLRGLREWRRLLRPRGLLVIVVPEGRLTFDRRRAVTPLAHMLADEASRCGESDLFHLPEILALHDRTRDPGAGSREEFERRCRDNDRWRAMHHHVFAPENLGPLLVAGGFRLEAVERAPPIHLIGVATRGTASGSAADAPSVR